MRIAAGAGIGPSDATFTAMMFDVTNVATNSAATTMRSGLGVRVCGVFVSVTARTGELNRRGGPLLKGRRCASVGAHGSDRERDSHEQCDVPHNDKRLCRRFQPDQCVVVQVL